MTNLCQVGEKLPLDQQNQKSPERYSPKEKGTISSPKTADEQEDQIEAMVSEEVAWLGLTTNSKEFSPH